MQGMLPRSGGHGFRRSGEVETKKTNKAFKAMGGLVSIIWIVSTILFLYNGMYYYAIGVTAALVIIVLLATANKEGYAANRLECIYTGFVICLFLGLLSSQAFSWKHLFQSLVVASLFSLPFVLIDKTSRIQMFDFAFHPALPPLSSGGNTPEGCFTSLFVFFAMLILHFFLSLFFAFAGVIIMFNLALSFMYSDISFSSPAKGEPDAPPVPDKFRGLYQDHFSPSEKENGSGIDGARDSNSSMTEPVEGPIEQEPAELEKREEQEQTEEDDSTSFHWL